MPVRCSPLQGAGSLLIAEDDAGVMAVLSSVLGRAGFEVVCVGDGKAAWEALCVNRYDVLITDNDMPRLTGLGLLRRLRPVHAELPVVFISGRMPWNDPDFNRLLLPGTGMEKPFSPSDLLDRIRLLLVGSTSLRMGAVQA